MRWLCLLIIGTMHLEYVSGRVPGDVFVSSSTIIKAARHAFSLCLFLQRIANSSMACQEVCAREIWDD